MQLLFRPNWKEVIKMHCTEKDHKDVIRTDSVFYREEYRPFGSITTDNLLHNQLNNCLLQKILSHEICIIIATPRETRRRRI
jgi:hypothetical protein